MWDRLTRYWHWAFVLSVTSGWLLGEFRNFNIMQWHFYCGYVTGGLVLIRICRGLFGPEAIRFSTLVLSALNIPSYLKTVFHRYPGESQGHNPLGSLSVLLMLIAISAQVLTGLFSEDDGLFYEGPFAHYLDSRTVVQVTGLHNDISRVVLVLVGLHVSAILFYLIWKKDNLIKRILP